MISFRLRSLRREVSPYGAVHRLSLVAEGLTMWMLTLCVTLASAAALDPPNIPPVVNLRPFFFGLLFGITVGWLLTISIGVGEGILLHIFLQLSLGVLFGALFSSSNKVGIAISLAAVLGQISSVAFTDNESKDSTIAAGLLFSIAVAFLGTFFIGQPLNHEKYGSFSGVLRQGLLFGLLVGVIFLAIHFRLLILSFETINTLRCLRKARSNPSDGSVYIKQCLAYWDELTVVRQPFLKQLLVFVGRHDRIGFLKSVVHLSANTYQQGIASDSLIELAVLSLLECRTVADIASIRNDLTWIRPSAEEWQEEAPAENLIERTEGPSEEVKRSLLGFFLQWILQRLGLYGVDSTTTASVPSNPIESSALEEFRKLGIVAATDRCLQISIDVSAAVAATNNYQKQIAFNRARRQLDSLLQLTFLSLDGREKRLFIDIVNRWLDLVNQDIDRLTEEERIQELIPNPYIAPRPLSPGSDVFVGRAEDFSFVEQHFLRQDGSVPIVMHGQPRIGKSSLLRHFVTNLPTNFLSVYVDMQAAAQVENSGGLLFNLADAIAKSFVERRLTVRIPRLAEYGHEPFIVFSKFLDSIESTLRSKGKRLILALDEFEEIEKKLVIGRINEDFLPFLRSMMQHRTDIGLIFAGSHNLDEMISKHWIPYFRSAVSRKIGYLDETNARKLITNPIDEFRLNYEIEAVDLLIAVTRCHPCLIQLACWSLVELKNEQRSHYVSTGDINLALTKALRTGDYVFRGLWDWIPETERRLLSILAVSPRLKTSELNQTFAMAEVETKQAIERLMKSEILQCSEDREHLKCTFQVELFQRWIRQNAESLG